MPTALTLDANVNLNLKQAEAQWRRFEQVTNNRTSQGGFSALTKQAKDFDKQLGQVTNRVVAFGTAFGALSIIERSFTTFIKSTIDIEQGLARINVNLGESAEGLKKFSSGLFNAARETGSSFEDASKAAEELARQGLGAEDTLKRLKDALTLSRIAGLSQAEAVETLTAALNSFNKSALTSSEVLNKFVAVDTNFAVSSKDLAEGVSRVGATAQAAGVGIDQLIGLITSLQQTTARGGTTIGNGLKTIFTRLQANPETVTALESVGVAIKDTSGNLRSAIDILQDYAVARTKVGEAERVALDRTVSGTQQINVLKAALADLSKQNSVYASALKTSTNATDEAIRKNEELNKTLVSLLNSTEVSIKQLFSTIGSHKLGPIFKELLQGADEARKLFSGDVGKDLGASLGEGIISGLSNIITGPAFITAAALIGKILVKVFSSVQQDISQLLNINTVAAQRAKVQERIVDLLGLANAAEQKQYQLASNVLEKKQALLAIQERLSIEANIGTSLQNAFIGGSSFGRTKIRGINALRGIGGAGAPNFADPLGAAIGREQMAGLAKSQIYVDRDPRVANFANPLGLLVANTRDEPMGGYQGVNRVLAQGGDPKRSGIANFAAPLSREAFIQRGEFVSQDKLDAINKILISMRGLDSSRLKTAATELNKLTEGFNKSAQGLVTGNRLSLQKAARAREGQVIGAGSYVTPESIAAFEAGRRAGVGNGKDNNGTYIFANSGRSLSINSVRDGLDYTRKQRRQFREAALYKQDIINDQIGGPNDSLISASVGYDTALPGIQAREERLRQAKTRADYRRATVEQNRIARQESIRAQNERLDDLRPQLQKDAYFTEQRGINDRFTKSQRRRGRILADANQARQARQQRAFQASFLLPFLGGFVEPGIQQAGFSTQGGTGGGITSGIVGGAANGAGLGGIFGPVGLGIGAAIGALVGGLSKANKSLEEFAQETAEATAQQGKVADATTRFRNIEDELSEAIKNGGDQRTIDRLSQQRLEALQSNPDVDVRNRLAQGFSSEDEAQKFADAVNAKTTQTRIGGDVSNLGRAQGADSLETKIGRAFQLPLKLLGGVGTLGTGYGLSQIGQGLIEGGRKNLDEDAADRTNLAKALLPLINRDNIGSINLKGAQIGNDFATPEQIKALSETLKSLGVNIDITDDNYRQFVQGLTDSTKQFRALKQLYDANSKGAQIGFSKTAFGSPLDLGVVGRSAFLGQDPFGYRGSRGDRAEARLAAFNQLGKEDPAAQSSLERNPAYKQDLAEVQFKRIADAAIRYIESTGKFFGGPLRNERGDPIQTTISNALKALSKGNGRTVEEAKLYQASFERGVNTRAREGLNASSLGGRYSTYAGTGRGTDGRIKVNPYGLSNDYAEKAAEAEAARQYFLAHTPLGRGGSVTTTRSQKRAPAAGRGGSISQATLDSLPAESQSAQQTAASRDADIDSYLKIVSDAKDTVANATKALQSTLKVVVTVNGLGSADNNAMVSAIQAALIALGVDVPKPMPPSPSSRINPSNPVTYAP